MPADKSPYGPTTAVRQQRPRVAAPCASHRPGLLIAAGALRQPLVSRLNLAGLVVQRSGVGDWLGAGAGTAPSGRPRLAEAGSLQLVSDRPAHPLLEGHGLLFLVETLQDPLSQQRAGRHAPL